jgi:hypothetical protein
VVYAHLIAALVCNKGERGGVEGEKRVREEQCQRGEVTGIEENG